MRANLRRDLTAAMKSRDKAAVAALRSALAAIENAEAPAVADSGSVRATSEHVAGAASGVGAAEIERRQLSDGDVAAIIRTEVDQRTSAAAEYESLGRDDLAGRLRAEAGVLLGYLG